MAQRLGLVAAAVALGACLAPVSQLCGDGSVCAPGQHCGIAGAVRLCVAATCSNGRLDPGESCDDGNNVSGDGCPADCRAACGDGVLDPGEHCDDGNPTDGDGCDHDCTLTGCGNGVLTAGEQCDDGNAIGGDGCDSDCAIDALAAQAYVKASNTDYGDAFGTCVALSSDGSLLAVGAPGESSSADEIDGEQTNNRAPGAGAVYVFARRRTTWRQQAYVKAANALAGAQFGCAVALSGDGATLAVGACREPSGATGIAAPALDRSAPDAGAVYVFARTGTMWRPEVYLKASNAAAGDRFGAAVSLSADGNTLVVGAPGESSAATGIGGDQTVRTAPGAGAVYVFVRGTAGWRQDAYVKASNTDAGDSFGACTAVAGDGTVLAVGAPDEASPGDPGRNTAPGAGAAYVFVRGAAGWREDAYLKATNADGGDHFGCGLAVSRDGQLLVAGAADEASAAVGADGNLTDNSASQAGAVYAFTRSATRWSPPVYLKASNTGATDRFGAQLALSGAGDRLVIGAAGEDSAAAGIGGDQGNNAASGAGAVYVLDRTGQTWRERAYLKASNPGTADAFGGSVALSADAAILVVGGPGDDSTATGIDGDQSQTSDEASTGAVYVFHGR